MAKKENNAAETKKPVLSADQIKAILDQINWSTVTVTVAKTKVNDGDLIRAALEQNPEAVKQLSEGVPTGMITYMVKRPGIPTPVKREIQIVPFRQFNDDTKEYVLSGVTTRGKLTLDRDKVLSGEQKLTVYIGQFPHVLDPKEHKEIINSLLADGGCNICATPFTYTVKVKEGDTEKTVEKNVFLGRDYRSGHIAAIDCGLLRGRYFDEKGELRGKLGSSKVLGLFEPLEGVTKKELFESIVEGQSFPVVGSTKEGKEFVSAVSFNVALNHIVRDETPYGVQLAKEAYFSVKETAKETAKEAPAEQKAEKKTNKKSSGKAQVI